MSDSDDVQEDFQITINGGYPFIKKFSFQHILTPRDFISDALMKMNGFRNVGVSEHTMSFVLEIGETIKISPIFQTQYQLNEYTETTVKSFFLEYISNQLNNSGILDALRDVPTKSNGQNENNCLVITLKAFRVSLGSTIYHYDSSLFTILQYFNKTESGEDLVLGTEVLLGYDNPSSTLHPESKLDDSNEVFYPEDVTGHLISENFNMVKSVNRELKEQGFQPILLRGLYKSGDTLVLTNTLYRHAVINPLEKFDEENNNIMTIKVGNSLKQITDRVCVCSHRIKTTPKDKYDRQALVMFIDIVAEKDIKDRENFKIGDPVTLISTPIVPVKTVNFNRDEYGEFIRALKISDTSCLCIETGSLHQLRIQNRGGKKTKKRSNKRFKSKKNNKNKTWSKTRKSNAKFKRRLIK